MSNDNDNDKDAGITAFGIFDCETDDFMVVEGRYRFYWSKDAAERMLVAIGDPRYCLGETRITKRQCDEEGELI